MNLDEARELLRECQRDRDEGRMAVAAGQATIESAQLIIQGILKRFPDLGADEQEWGGDLWEPKGDRPRGSEAVLSLLQVAENQWFTVVEMTEALEERNWLPESQNPPNAVRAALERLVAASDSHVEKGKYNSGTVVYRYHNETSQVPSSLPAPGYGFDEEPF